MGVGIAVALGAILLARLVRLLLRWWWSRHRTRSYAQVFSTLVALGVGALGVGVGLTVAFPSVRPVDLLGGLGVVSIAVGIAFQNVLSNLFAGVLILVREPFRAGDQIAVADVAGTVEGVNLRETVVRTFDGRRVLVPNSTVHGQVLTVQTGYAHIRTSVALGVDLTADLGRARRTAVEVTARVPGVAADPAPQCLLSEIASSSVTFELRFWSGARQLEALETRDRVIEAVVGAFVRAGIGMPAETRLLQAAPSLTEALTGRSGPVGRSGADRAAGGPGDGRPGRTAPGNGSP